MSAMPYRSNRAYHVPETRLNGKHGREQHATTTEIERSTGPSRWRPGRSLKEREHDEEAT